MSSRTLIACVPVLFLGLALPGGASDCALDQDNDNLSGCEEVALGTDPADADTDGGGASDGAEMERGTNPLDAADDFHAIVWSLEHSSAARGTSMDIIWSGEGPTNALEHGDHTGPMDLHVLPDEGQWISLNGTATWVPEDFRFILEDFRGKIERTAADKGGDVQEVISFDGTAARLVVQDPANETELVRMKFIVESRDGTTRLTSYTVLQDELLRDGATHEVKYDLGVPLYFEFDAWKRGNDLTAVEPYQIGLYAGSFEGYNGTWIVIYNEDPVIYQYFIPIHSSGGSLSGVKVCIQTEFPVWCGGIER